jgi:hypothetical protein
MADHGSATSGTLIVTSRDARKRGDVVPKKIRTAVTALTKTDLSSALGDVPSRPEARSEKPQSRGPPASTQHFPYSFRTPRSCETSRRETSL